MKFMLFVLPTVPGTMDDRKRLRPIGRNNERYQQMLDELRKLVIFADEVGFDCVATTEHHFHSEGFETSVAPLLLYADLAARTKRIKFSPLGLVLPAATRTAGSMCSASNIMPPARRWTARRSTTIIAASTRRPSRSSRKPG